MQLGPGAADVHTHVTCASGAKVRALVHGDLGFFEEEALQFFGRHIQSLAVEPDEIGGFSFGDFDFGNFRRDEGIEVFQVTLKVFQQLIGVVVAFVVSDFDWQRTEYRSAIGFVVFDSRVEPVVVAAVGNDGGSGPHAGDVEGFTRVDAYHAVGGGFSRQGAEGNVFAAFVDDVGVDFVRDDEHVIFQAQFGHPGQLFVGEAFADRIVRTTQEEHGGAFLAKQFFEVGKVDIKAAFFSGNKLAAQDMPAVVGDDGMEGMIDRHLHDDIVPGLGESPHA